MVRRVRLRPAPRPSRSGSGVQVVQHVGCSTWSTDAPTPGRGVRVAAGITRYGYAWTARRFDGVAVPAGAVVRVRSPIAVVDAEE